MSYNFRNRFFQVVFLREPNAVTLETFSLDTFEKTQLKFGIVILQLISLKLCVL